MRYLLSFFFLSFISTSTVNGADWTGFRGGSAQGVSPEKNLPTVWAPETNVVWKIAPLGWGSSSPTVVGDRIYLTSQTDDTGLHVIAIERKTGEIVWKTKVGAGKMKSNELQNMATPTPVSDGKRIWALYGTGDLACLDADGKVVWSRQLQKDHGEYKIMWGMGTSPVLHGGKLYIVCLHTGPSYVLAVDSESGKDVWKQDRDVGAKAEAQDSYSTPIVLSVAGKDYVVVSGGDHINAYDAKTGQQKWISSGLDVPHPYGRTIAGPTAAGDAVVTVASGFRNQGYVIAVRGDGEGDISKSHRMWTATRYAPDCPTPVAFEGLVYLVRDDGMGSCLDLKSGEPKWQERLFSANVKISPVAGDGKVYFLNGQGNCVVVRAGPKFEVLARNDLKEESLCTPALSHGHVYLRTKKHLYSIGAK